MSDELILAMLRGRLADGGALDPVEQRQLLRLAIMAQVREAALRTALQPSDINRVLIDAWLNEARKRQGWGNEDDWSHNVLNEVLLYLQARLGLVEP